MPNTQIIELAVIHIDKKGNNHEGTLITPVKIQNINKNQGLFTIELNEQMTRLNPVTGKSKTLTKINGLALYNTGEKLKQFKSSDTSHDCNIYEIRLIKIILILISLNFT